VCHDHADVVDLLLSEGAKTEIRLEGGDNRILRAGGAQQCLLFDMGQFSGSSPLHLAALLRRHTCVDLLISAGADIRDIDDQGLQPFQYVIRSKHYFANVEDASCIHVAEQLFAHGADVNARFSEYGVTALHMVAETGQIGMMLWLISHGADVNLTDYEGCTPLHYAASAGKWSAGELLLQNRARVDPIGSLSLDYRTRGTPLLLAAYLGDYRVAEILLNHGASVRRCDDVAFRTSLHWSAEIGDARTTELLLKHDAPVDSRDRDGHTPLHRAAQGGHANVAEVLLSHGAEVNARNEHGNTPLDYASDDTIAQMIRQHGGVSGKAVR
jgi:serine/threonine-protein phosphatase 6 regulatory ankyrin repeat subunit A/serine/threonine-protein phosphatase 6 regulatory ankyrin repeat subunit B